jgi:hypothetical protein
MGRTVDYVAALTLLKGAFEKAEVARSKQANAVPKIIVSATQILFQSKTQAFREALVGCILVRILDPQIDIRKPYVNQGDDAFNGRTLDEKVINPFFQEKEIPCSKGPYLSALRRSISFIPETEKGIRDKDAYGAMLAFIGELEGADQEQARAYLFFLMSSFVELRDKSTIALSRINRLSTNQYSRLFEGLLATMSGGRFPVVLVVAALEALKSAYGLAWEINYQGINVADAASGAGGDVTVIRKGEIVLSIEITERVVDADRVRATFRTKISPNALEDYIFMTGVAPTAAARAAAAAYFAQGHEINFVPLTDWLVTVLMTLGSSGRKALTEKIIELLDSFDVPATMKVAWNDQVRSIVA